EWAQEANAWANPPWELIPEAFDKVIKEAISITIFVPYFQTGSSNADGGRLYCAPSANLSLLEVDPMLAIRSTIQEGTTACGKTPWGVTLVAKIGVKSSCFDSKREQPAIHGSASQTVHSGAKTHETEYETYVNIIEQYHNLRHYTPEETANKLQAGVHDWPQT
ncbi:hypothetical protein SARC_12119, partial [Sphaeroforma arctica JP610]